MLVFKVGAIGRRGGKAPTNFLWILFKPCMFLGHVPFGLKESYFAADSFFYL